MDQDKWLKAYKNTVWLLCRESILVNSYASRQRCDQGSTNVGTILPFVTKMF